MEESVDLHEEAGKENEQTLVNLNPARKLRVKMKSKLMFLFFFFLGGSLWANLDLGRWYRPHCVRSVLAPSVKILPYKPPARLIRAKNFLRLTVKSNLFCRRLMVKF